jgi:tripartite-type tricarboxylate transporter receptor subunit TctC
MNRRLICKTALLAPSALLALFGLTASVQANEAYPSKVIRFVVPYPPGGPTDLMARLLQPELQTRLGATVVIENKAGAGGNVGTADVARQAPADGYTLLLAASGPMAVNQSLFKTLPYNPLIDLVPVIQISSFPLVLEVHPSVGVKNIKEFMALTKAKPDLLSYASAGNGTPQHLAGEIYNKATGAKMSHIPYRGAGPALNDLLGGQVKVMFDVLGSSLQYINANKLVALAVTSAQRSPMLPNLPTLAESGLPGFEMTGWHGIVMRAGTPPEIVNKLNKALNDAFADPVFRKKWEQLGTPVVAGSAEKFGQLIRTESVRLGRVVRESGATAD